MSAVEPIPEERSHHPERVRLRFEQADGATKEARVPAGTTLFDAASWNAVAIDSTCGGHGTCKKCKVRVASGSVAISAVDPRAFEPAELKAGWRLACRAEASEDVVVEVPPLQTRPKAALAGVGRHVILRPAVQKRYLELTEPTLEDQVSGSRPRARGDGRPRAARPARARARARAHASRRRLEGDRRPLRRRADRGGGGRHHRAPLRARVRPRHDDRRREPARPRDGPAGRGALDAEQAAAVRRGRDLADLRGDDGPGRARAAARARARDARRAHRGGARPRAASSRARCTRSWSQGT